MHKILRFWVPILTYLREKNLDCILEKIISVKIGQNGYKNVQNFILIPNLKTKLRKIDRKKRFILKKLAKGQFFVNKFWVQCFFFNFAFGF